MGGYGPLATRAVALGVSPKASCTPLNIWPNLKAHGPTSQHSLAQPVALAFFLPMRAALASRYSRLCAKSKDRVRPPPTTTRACSGQQGHGGQQEPEA
jgi:hypothetical protein